MVDGLVSDFGSSEYHPHVLSVSLCVCVALVQASPAIRKKNLLEQVSKDLLGAVTGSWQPSLPPSISLFLCLSECLAVCTGHKIQHCSQHRAGILPCFLSLPMAKAAFTMICFHLTIECSNKRAQVNAGNTVCAFEACKNTNAPDAAIKAPMATLVNRSSHSGNVSF